MLRLWSRYQEDYSALTDNEDLADDTPVTPRPCCCLCLAPCLPLILLLPESSLRLTRQLYALANTPAVPTHGQELMLQIYLQAILPSPPDSTPPMTPSDAWVLAGFQSRTPWTDFRAAGDLAVRSLHWIATEHPEHLRRIAEDLHITAGASKAQLLAEAAYYPFSASFINVVFMIYNYCRIGSDLRRHLQHSCPTATPAECRSMTLSKYRGSKINAVRLLAILAQDSASDSEPAEDPAVSAPHATTVSQVYPAAFGELVTLACIKLHRDWLKLS